MPTQNPINKYYICKFCGKEHKLLGYATHCEEQHSKLYVPLSAEEINRLLNFIYTKDSALLGDPMGQEIIKTLRKYLRAKTS